MRRDLGSIKGLQWPADGCGLGHPTAGANFAIVHV